MAEKSQKKNTKISYQKPKDWKPIRVFVEEKNDQVNLKIVANIKQDINYSKLSPVTIKESIADALGVPNEDIFVEFKN